MNRTLIFLIGYLILIFGIAIFFSRKESLNYYFLNNKKTNLWLMTFSTLATIIGAGAVVATISEIYNSGISYGIAIFISFIFGMIILSFFAKKIKAIGEIYNAHTIVDFFEKRFDKKNKIITGVLQIFLLIVWIAVQAIAIGSLTSVLIGIEYTIALILSGIIVILYTSVGGLKIDIITDFIQFWIIFIVFFILAFIGYNEIGGFSNLLSNIPEGHLNPFNFGGIIWMIGAIILGGFFYLGNTSHWQRIYSAKSQKVAKNSFLLAIPFVIIFSLIILFLGLISASNLFGIKQETAIFVLIKNILPPPILGIAFAAFLALIMSSIDSLLIGGSTIIYHEIFKKNNSKKNILYAKLITAIFGIFGFLLAIIHPKIIELSLFVTYLSLIFIPPIIYGIYSKKTSANASFYSILIPTILLFATYPLLIEKTFILTSLFGILIIIFYDKVFKKISLHNSTI